MKIFMSSYHHIVALLEEILATESKLTGPLLNHRKYGKYHEMHQKACEWGIYHLTTFAFFLEMPQNRWIDPGNILIRGLD